MIKTTPVLRVFDYGSAIDFYVNWLGFTIDWEKKPDEGPFRIQLSLKEITLHLVQYPDKGGPGTWVLITGFKNMVPFRKIISLKSSKFPKPHLRQVPGEPNTLSMTVTDPFFNRIEFREVMR
jgi:hypothetical protein